MNAPGLGNVLWESRLFWDGRAEGLEVQALEPIADPVELHLPLAEAVAKLQADERYPPRFEAAFGTDEVTAERIEFRQALLDGGDDLAGVVRRIGKHCLDLREGTCTVIGDDREDEIVAAGEVGVEGPSGESGRFADGLDGRPVDPLVSNDLAGPVEQARPRGLAPR